MQRSVDTKPGRRHDHEPRTLQRHSVLLREVDAGLCRGNLQRGAERRHRDLFQAASESEDRLVGANQAVRWVREETRMMTITREIAEKVRDTVAAGLSNGVGNPMPGQMCVEAAVCYALGLPHGDDPGCVTQSLRRLKIRLNDARWSSNQARASGLRRLAIAQLASAGVLDKRAFVQRLAELTIRRMVPIALRAASKLNPRNADALEAAAVRCEREGTVESARAARTAAYAAAAYAAAAAAYAAAAYAAAADDAVAAAAAAAAADADAAAAYAAAAYDDAAAAADAADAERDRILSQFAEWVVEILIDLKAPGCQFLDELVPLA